MFNTAPLEIPLEKNKMHTLIPWMIGLMIYLSTLSLTTTVMLRQFTRETQDLLKNAVSVRFLSQGSPESPPAVNHPVQSHSDPQLMSFLKSLPGVVAIEEHSPVKEHPAITEHPVIKEHPAKGKKPSLEKPNPLKENKNFEVVFAQDTLVDVPALERDLQRTFPDVRLDDHRIWRKKVSAIASPLLSISVIMMSVIAFSAVLTLVYMTHCGLMIYEKVIGVLKVLGAENRFIAQQFQRYAFNISLKGGLIGLLLSVGTDRAMEHKLLKHAADLGLLSFLGNSHAKIEVGMIMVLTPVVIMGIVVLATRLTVLYVMDNAESNGKWAFVN